MKLQIIILTLLFLGFSHIYVYSQNDERSIIKDFGTISINYVTNGEEDSLLCFYGNSELKETVLKINIEKLDYLLRYSGDTMGVNPLEFMPTPGRIIFRCVDSTQFAYKIVLREKNFSTCWIKKSVLIDFSDWLKYFKGADYITTNQELREKQDANCDVVENPDSCFTYDILSIEADWVEIETSWHCKMYEKSPSIRNARGWVKWRDGNKILIQKTYTE